MNGVRFLLLPAACLFGAALREFATVGQIALWLGGLIAALCLGVSLRNLWDYWRHDSEWYGAHAAVGDLQRRVETLEKRADLSDLPGAGS